MSLVGKKAPLFNNPAIVGGEDIVESFSLEQFIGNKEVLFFFYSKDFAVVCPTEILAFQDRLEEFKNRNVEVVGCSTDTEEAHLAWLNLEKEKGGIMGVTFPLVVDSSKTISSNFGVLGGDWKYDDNETLHFEGSAVAFRGTFLIDQEGIIRHESINDLPIGRNIEDYLRIVDAWQHTQNFDVVCPANWEKGDDAIVPSREGIAQYLASH